jgi:hypothetical protein
MKKSNIYLIAVKRQDVNGNTYHSIKMQGDQLENAIIINNTYGYGNQYYYTAVNYLKDSGIPFKSIITLAVTSTNKKSELIIC